MLILRLKQAECALADGRLEEACELVSRPEVRSHRRGQELAGQIASALIDRGRQHLASGRLIEAEGDADRACRLAGNLPEAAQLRAAVVTAMNCKHNAEHDRAQVLHAARQQIQQGNLTVGHKLLADLDPATPQAALMLREVTQQRAAIHTLVEKATEAVARADWEAAIDLLERTGPAAVADARVRELVTNVSKNIREQIREAIDSGRLDLADSLLNRLRRLDGRGVDVEQLGRMLEQCRHAWMKIAAGEFPAAGEILRRLELILPSARWIKSTLEDLNQAEDAKHRLRSSPVALLDGRAQATMTWQPETPRPVGVLPFPGTSPGRGQGEGPAAYTGPAGDTSIPSRFFIQVDGVGAFCILRERRVTLGPLSGKQTCDLGLITDAATPAATIERSEEDYILHSAQPIAINEQPTTQKLLANGDRLALSPRCRMNFRLPSPASTTAILDLTGARIPRGDVRRVILLDRELIIGPGASSHIRCDEMPQNLALLVRDGQLVAQAKCDVYVNDSPAGRAAVIPLGTPVRVGEMRFVVTRA